MAAETHVDSFRTSDESLKSKLTRVADRFRTCRKKVIKQLKESMQLAEGVGLAVCLPARYRYRDR